MSVNRGLHVSRREDRRMPNGPMASKSASFVIPLALLIAGILGWILYGSLSPTVDNTGSTTPVRQTDLPQSKPTPPTTP